MVAGFFEMRCAYDLLGKLERDFHKLLEAPSSDTLFNFYVTGGSIRDWIKAERPDLKDELQSLYDQDLLFCLEIGNKAKHFVLTQRRKELGLSDPNAEIAHFGALNSAPLNTRALNGSLLVWRLTYDSRIAVADVFSHASTVLERIKAFFADHDIGHHYGPRNES